MNEIFKLHFNSSGPSGGSMSSRHMNRNQARQVIRENIINNCILHRNDEGFSSVIFNYIANIEEMLGHKIPFHFSDDNHFENHMGYNGALFWIREYQRCMIAHYQTGTEATPSKTDGIIRESMILLASRVDVDYHILWDEDFCKYNNPEVLQQNTFLIDELDKHYNMLDAFVDGYLWAQSLEKQVEKKCKNDLDKSVAYLLLEAIDTFEGISPTYETIILDNGIVAAKEVE